jgi:uncharacterized membrane protein
LRAAAAAGTIQALVRLGGTTRIGVALLLLALVAGASTARFDGGHALSAPELAFLVMLVAVVAALAIAVGTVALSGGAFVAGERRRKGATAMPLVLLLAIFAALLLMSEDAEIERSRPAGDGRGSRELQPADDFFGLGGGDVFATVAVAVMAGIAVLAVLLFAFGLNQRRRQAVETPLDEEEAVMQALDESLDDLRRERDVRRAIIACYARMEHALAYAGNARRPAEAPFEYLVRILEQITTNGRAARSLTELFERAKFGSGPMSEGDKQQAIEALELLRAELLR